MVRQASTVNPIQLYTLLSPPPNRPFFHQLIPSKVSFTPSVGKCWLPYYIRNSRFHSLNQKTPTATCRLIQPQHGKSCKARVRSCQLNQQKVSTHQEETSQHGESNWTVLTHQWYTSQHGKSNTAMHSAKPATPNRPFFTNSFHRKILSLRQSENVGFHTTVRNSRFHSLNQKTPTATCRLIQPQHGKSCKARVRSCQLNQQKVSTHQEETSQHGESNWTVLTHQWYTSQHGKSNGKVFTHQWYTSQKEDSRPLQSKPLPDQLPPIFAKSVYLYFFSIVPINFLKKWKVLPHHAPAKPAR